MSNGRFRSSTPRPISTSTSPRSTTSQHRLRRRNKNAKRQLRSRTRFESDLGRPLACPDSCSYSDSRLGCLAEAKRGDPRGNLSTTAAQPVAQPHLIRALGRRDLVLLFVVAVFNLNVVPSIAANGGVTIWLWIMSLVLFFWPQGIAVIELADRYPGEGGVYLWAKRIFGDFHGFLSGWCYWTNNIFYVPTVLLYFVGISVFVAGPGAQALADKPSFAFTASAMLLALLVVLNVLGLGVGKWVNNLGGIGTGITAVTLIALGILVAFRYGTPL